MKILIVDDIDQILTKEVFEKAYSLRNFFNTAMRNLPRLSEIYQDLVLMNLPKVPNSLDSYSSMYFNKRKRNSKLPKPFVSGVYLPKIRGRLNSSR